MKGKESAGNKLLQSQKGKTGSAHASVEKNVPKFDKNKFSGFLKEINERSRQGLDQLSRRKPNQPDSQVPIRKFLFFLFFSC